MIQITHFVNPHKFFYKRKQDEGFDKQLDDMEVKIKGTVCKKNEHEEIEIGDTVGVFMKDWNKWIRGIVKEKYQNGSAHIWAIDYGVPYITPLVKLVKLPPMYAKMNGKYQRIHVGGIINCIPAESSYDFETNDMVFGEQAQWSAKAMEISQCGIGRAMQLKFEEVHEIKMGHETLIFGNLKIQKPDGTWIDLAECLLKAQMAKATTGSWNSHVLRLDSIKQIEWKTINNEPIQADTNVSIFSMERMTIEVNEASANINRPTKNENPAKMSSFLVHQYNSDGQQNGNNSFLNEPSSSHVFKKRSISSSRSVKGAFNYNASKSMQFNIHQNRNRSDRNDLTSEFPKGWHTNGDLRNQRYREEINFFEASFRRPNNVKENANDDDADKSTEIDSESNENGAGEHVNNDKPKKNESTNTISPEKVSTTQKPTNNDASNNEQHKQSAAEGGKDEK
ncbi:putative ATP-dependent RNA helicase SoYb [Contarinia nasturtii]|uniref:putative ATP-dependent RNA helicase SoYb n=1 Tax=Contarinia nasturtii TaxID=265458 RepID=UPI0012D41044|nr:putative ATP-dependent RNA helicase SoYb [Contarinia nasturtii]